MSPWCSLGHAISATDTILFERVLFAKPVATFAGPASAGQIAQHIGGHGELRERQARSNNFVQREPRPLDILATPLGPVLDRIVAGRAGIDHLGCERAKGLADLRQRTIKR